jgi:hypothetical protein
MIKLCCASCLNKNTKRFSALFTNDKIGDFCTIFIDLSILPDVTKRGEVYYVCEDKGKIILQ